ALSHTLAEPVALSISHRIRRHVEAWACTASAEVDFVCTGDVGLMTDEEAHHVLRLIQEALGNALKHADPERVCISLSHDEGRVRVAVVDDGNGVGQKRGVGLGMRSMRRRAKLLGSRLEIETGTAGTGVSVVFAPAAAIQAT
ncbi:MAG: sensor histidine kinase, partial [Polyangiales bacterium]